MHLLAEFCHMQSFFRQLHSVPNEQTMQMDREQQVIRQSEPFYVPALRFLLQQQIFHLNI